MTGPAYGKIRVSAGVYIGEGKERRKIEANVYVHLKGYALARVTHLDIESPELNLMKEKGRFLLVRGIEGGIEIPGLRIMIKSRKLSKILEPGEKTRTWVGQKKDGIYIGFRREQIMKMEKEWGGRLRRRVFIRDPP